MEADEAFEALDVQCVIGLLVNFCCLLRVCSFFVVLPGSPSCRSVVERLAESVCHCCLLQYIFAGVAALAVLEQRQTVGYIEWQTVGYPGVVRPYCRWCIMIVV